MHKFLNELADYDYRRENNAYEKENYSGFVFDGLKAALIIHSLSKVDVPKLDRKWKNPEILAEIEKYKENNQLYFLN